MHKSSFSIHNFSRFQYTISRVFDAKFIIFYALAKLSHALGVVVGREEVEE